MKRYTQWCAGTHNHQMSPDLNGAWVLYEDIQKELAAARQGDTAIGSASAAAPSGVTAVPAIESWICVCGAECSFDFCTACATRKSEAVDVKSR